MSRYLVTGGAGFIGSHICETLVKQGHSVRVLDNFFSGKRQNLSPFSDALEIMEGDIRSPETCAKAAEGVEFILHQAALRSVPKSMQNPQDYSDVNITGVLNMLEAALKNKIKCFVLASSSSIYGEIDDFPEKESFLPQPISPYALSKLAGEHYCRIFTRHYQLPTVSLRYFNVFGPRQSPDDEYAVVIPKFITCMLRDEPVPVYGTGKQSRDFTYIANVVQANILAVEKRERASGGIFNVASGKDHSILNLADNLNKIMGKKIKPKFLPARPGDVFRTLADLSRSKEILGYNPGLDFIEGLESTVSYFQKNA